MDYAEAIERLEYLKVKAENSLSNSNTSSEWLKEDVKGTITAFTMAIEALGKQNEIVHCKDCKNWGKSAPDGVLAEAGGICYEAGWLCGEQGFCMYGSEVD